MALIHSFENHGNLLFRYRGQIPVFLFITAIPVIIFTDYSLISNGLYLGLIITSIVISFLGLVVRSIAIGTTPKGTSGRNTKEQVAESLNTKGIYSIVRHPLYLGNYLMWLGLLIFCFNIYYVIIISLLFWLYYERIMFAEERFLEKKYGEEYLSWSLQVPAFIPAFGKYESGNINFSLVTVLRREYSGVLATVLGFAYIDNLRMYYLTSNFDWSRPSMIALAIAIVLALTLRTLKHSGVLNEEGRS
jgi:protein-S-isoprenylcysteine O-methyltransferase Ste14